MIFAAQEGHTDIVKTLLKARAYVNAANDIGATALWYASGEGHTDIVNMLLEADADMNKTKTSGTLIGSTALIIASQKGHMDIVEALLKAGADLNKEAPFGGVYYTALGFAKKEDYPEIVKLLIESGAKE